MEIKTRTELLTASAATRQPAVVAPLADATPQSPATMTDRVDVARTGRTVQPKTRPATSAPAGSAAALAPAEKPQSPAAAPPTVLTALAPPAPLAQAGPNLLTLARDPLSVQLGQQLYLDNARADVAASLVRDSGVDPGDKVKAAMLANYADLTVKTASLGLKPDSLQMRALHQVLVANLREEQSPGNATHVWNVGDGAFDIGVLLNQGGGVQLSPQELGNRVVAAMLHDPPNKKPFGPAFLLHNKFAANRVPAVLGGLRDASNGADLDALIQMAQRRGLDHHVAPSWMAYSTVLEAAKAMPSMRAALSTLPEDEGRKRVDLLNGVLLHTVLNKGVDPAVGLPSGEALLKTLHEKGLPVTQQEASTLMRMAGKLLDPLHTDQLAPDAEHRTYRVKFDAQEQRLLDGINAAYREECLSGGQIPQDVGTHFDWYTPPNVSQFPHAREEQAAALHMIAADGLANYAKTDAFLVRQPDGSVSPGKFLSFYPKEGPSVAYGSVQGAEPGGSYHSYRQFLADMPAVADVAGREHDRTKALVTTALDDVGNAFPLGYLTLDARASGEKWRDEASHPVDYVMANPEQILPAANRWRAQQGMPELDVAAVRQDRTLADKALTAYHGAYMDAFAQRLDELDKNTEKISA